MPQQYDNNQPRQGNPSQTELFDTISKKRASAHLVVSKLIEHTRITAELMGCDEQEVVNAVRAAADGLHQTINSAVLLELQGGGR